MSNPTNPAAVSSDAGAKTRLVIQEAHVGISSDETRTALIAMANALNVIASDTALITYLTEHDPQALQQVRDALGMADRRTPGKALGAAMIDRRRPGVVPRGTTVGTRRAGR